MPAGSLLAQPAQDARLVRRMRSRSLMAADCTRLGVGWGARLEKCGRITAACTGLAIMRLNTDNKRIIPDD